MTSVLAILVRHKFGVAVAGIVALAGGLTWSFVNEIQEEERERVIASMAANSIRTEREARARSDSVTQAARAEIALLRAENDSVIALEAVRLGQAGARVSPARIVLTNAGATAYATLDSLCLAIGPAYSPICGRLALQINGIQAAAQDLDEVRVAQIESLSATVAATAEIIASQDELEVIRVTERAAMQAELDAIAAAYQASINQVDGNWYDGLVSAGKYAAVGGVGVLIGRSLN